MRRVIELRQKRRTPPPIKRQALRAWRGVDGRVRGAFKFHGAATGRWSGSGPQPQNFRRETEEHRRQIRRGDDRRYRNGAAARRADRGCRRHCPRHDLRAAGPPVIGRRFQRHRKRAAGLDCRRSPTSLSNGRQFFRTRDPQRRSLCRDWPRAWAPGRRPHAPKARSPTWRSATRAAPGAYKNFAPENDTASDAQIERLQASLARPASADRAISGTASTAPRGGGHAARQAADPLWPADLAVRTRSATLVFVHHAAERPPAVLPVRRTDDRTALTAPPSRSWTTADRDRRLDAMQLRPRLLRRDMDGERCFRHRPRSVGGGDGAARSRWLSGRAARA